MQYKKVRYRCLHSTQRVKHAYFILGVGVFRLKFYGNGVIPCQNIDTIREVVDCTPLIELQLGCWKFLDNDTL